MKPIPRINEFIGFVNAIMRAWDTYEEREKTEEKYKKDETTN